jgi:hypothetical protein
MLKESDELDLIIPDLLNAMNIDVLAGAQKGVRQDGVDVHGIGIDPDTGLKTNFLITIKRGDISRTVWDSGVQSVRQSLVEIIDVYVKQKIPKTHRKLPIKIILCFGGEMKQEVLPNWSGFTEDHPKFIFDEWSGDKLSGLIEKHLTDENLFFDEVKKYMRRNIVFLSDPDYNLNHYVEMLDNLLNSKLWLNKANKENEVLKALKIISLSLGMINQYSIEAGNLEHTINASELSLLRAWSFIIENKLHESKKILQRYYQLNQQYINYSAQYYTKMEKHYFCKDGMCKQSQDSITSSIVTFKQIGILATFGLEHLLFAHLRKDEQGQENAKIISNALVQVIDNNTISGSPCYDGQTIDICLAIYFLCLTGKFKEIKSWIRVLIHRFHFSYNILERHFPVSCDSLDMLIEFEFNDDHTKEKMADLSTLIPTLAYWCAILDFQEEYINILKLVEDLKETCLQLWFPGKGIKEYFYKKYAANEGGIAEAPLYLPETLDELKTRIKEFIEFSAKNESFETVWNDAPPALPLVASRQFRTPVVPFYWLRLINVDMNPEVTLD